MARTFVIAETGCTHEGNRGALLALAELASSAGADALKAQWTSDPERMCARRHAPEYRPYYEWLKFPEAWLGELRDRCHQRGLQFGCTVYLPEDVATIDPFVDFYKVASFEADAQDLLETYADRMRTNAKDLIVSRGFSADAIPPDEPRGRIKFLRCVSAYPAPIGDLRLRWIREGQLDGFSDHSIPSMKVTGALVVAAGATIIERHVRLESCSMRNPDYKISMGAHGFQEYVDLVRLAERAMGEPTDRGPAASEAPMVRHRVVVEKPKEQTKKRGNEKHAKEDER